MATVSTLQRTARTVRIMEPTTALGCVCAAVALVAWLRPTTRKRAFAIAVLALPTFSSTLGDR